MITRFAPSPTGYLHLGHAFAAVVAWRLAKTAGAESHFLIRMEDIDHTRVRPEYYQAILDDLAWLGLDWHPQVWRQLDRLPEYTSALECLQQAGLVYPCFCTRKHLAIDAELNAPQEQPGATEQMEDAVPRYSGRCRTLSPEESQARITAGHSFAWRLNAERAWHACGAIAWQDRLSGPHITQRSDVDDVILARKDIGTSYHLAVVVDDAAQGVSLVTRGADLFSATPVQLLLQKLLGLPQPEYLHHRLIRDENGRRLAKRDSARSLKSLRAAGFGPEWVFQCLGTELS